jgi:polysaccharide lyase-like protein
LRRLALAAASSLLAATAARASVVWRGDYETRDLSQWDRVDGLMSRLTIVSSPVHQGSYALRTVLRAGDVANNGTRNELVLLQPQTEGMDRYYAWSTMFDASYPSADTWQVFTQWHHSGCCGSPPVELDVVGEKVQLTINTRAVWTAPLVRSVWHDFVVRVRWSANPDLGLVELWYDGRKVVDRLAAQTLYADQIAYLKQGLYRDASIQADGVVYHDGMTIGTTLADVAPQLVPPPPDAGTPDGGPPADPPDGGTALPPSNPPQSQIGKSGIGFPSGGCGSAGPVGGLLIAAFALLRPRRRRR